MSDQDANSLEDITNGTCGLYNLGNTCYVNSILQCLSNCKDFNSILSRRDINNILQSHFKTTNYSDLKTLVNNCLFIKIKELFNHIWNNSYNSFKPKSFIKLFKEKIIFFQNKNQHDSQEALLCILDCLNEELSLPNIEIDSYKNLIIDSFNSLFLNEEKNKKEILNLCKRKFDDYLIFKYITDFKNNHKKISVINEIFEGCTISQLKCSETLGKSVIFDPFFFITLSIPEDNIDQSSSSEISSSSSSNSSSEINTESSNKNDESDCQKDNYKQKKYEDEGIIEWIVNYKNYDFENLKSNCINKIIESNLESNKSCINTSHEITSSQNETEESSQNETEESNQNETEESESSNKSRESSQNETEESNQNETEESNQNETEESNQNETEESNQNESEESNKSRESSQESNHNETEDDEDSLNTVDEDSLYDNNIFDPFKINLSKRYKKELKKFNIYDLFNNFITPENLKDDNKWFSPYAEKNVDAEKKLMLFDTPKILIVCIKRFDNSFNKLNNLIDFPIYNLDITPYLHKSHISKYTKYNLFAINNHTNFNSGFGGISFGHYYSYCKNKNDNKWYNFNDDDVDEIEEDDIITKDAYILFYEAIE